MQYSKLPWLSTTTTLYILKGIDWLSPCDLQVCQDHIQLQTACSPAGPAPFPYYHQCWAVLLEGRSGSASVVLCLTSAPSQSCAETASPSGSQRRYSLVRSVQGSGITLAVAVGKSKQDFLKWAMLHSSSPKNVYLVSVIQKNAHADNINCKVSPPTSI